MYDGSQYNPYSAKAKAEAARREKAQRAKNNQSSRDVVASNTPKANKAFKKNFKSSTVRVTATPAPKKPVVRRRS